MSRSADYAVGMVKVADSRIDELNALYKPKKTKSAEITVGKPTFTGTQFGVVGIIGLLLPR